MKCKDCKKQIPGKSMCCPECWRVRFSKIIISDGIRVFVDERLKPCSLQ